MNPERDLRVIICTFNDTGLVLIDLAKVLMQCGNCTLVIGIFGLRREAEALWHAYTVLRNNINTGCLNYQGCFFLFFLVQHFNTPDFYLWVHAVFRNTVALKKKYWKWTELESINSHSGIVASVIPWGCLLSFSDTKGYLTPAFPFFIQFLGIVFYVSRWIIEDFEYHCDGEASNL